MNLRGRDDLTISLSLGVVSLGGSMTITERLTCTIGTAGIVRNFNRKGCDCVATTYRCLFESPSCKLPVRIGEKYETKGRTYR